MKGHRLDDDLVRSSFERRARGFPAPWLFERILRATGRAHPGPSLVLVPQPLVATSSHVRRFALLAAAPLTVLLLAVLIAGQRSPLLVGASVGGAGTATSAAITDDDEGEAADEDEQEGSADDDEADEAEDGADEDETGDDD